MNRTFLRSTFVDVNDQSAQEYNQSVIQYLFSILEGDDWKAMSSYQSYLDGGKKMLTEIIEELNNALDVDDALSDLVATDQEAKND